jgi:hypothetical protein
MLCYAGLDALAERVKADVVDAELSQLQQAFSLEREHRATEQARGARTTMPCMVCAYAVVCFAETRRAAPARVSASLRLRALQTLWRAQLRQAEMERRAA